MAKIKFSYLFIGVVCTTFLILIASYFHHQRPHFKKMENIGGGGKAITSFCLGFGSIYAGYGFGAWMNWWNPMGQTAIAAGVIVGLACGAHELYHS